LPDAAFLKVQGRRMEIRRTNPGARDAPVLVFLHEGLGCVSMWGDFPRRLADVTGLPALAYSRWGYGASDPCELPRPLDFMHTEAQQVLPALLTAAGIRRHILIGHSDGGSIALIYAGHRPLPGLCGVVTEAAHVFCEPVTLASIRDARRRYQQTDFRQRLQRYHGTNTDTAFWGWNQAWLDPQFTQWNIEAYLPHITVPLLVMQGDRDPYGSQRQVTAISDGVGGPVQVSILADCGHSPHQQQPEAALTAMTDFIAGLPVSPT